MDRYFKIMAHLGELLGPERMSEYDHAVRVSKYARNQAERVVALCHDVIEDNGDRMTFHDLRGWGLTPEEVYAVVFLTKEEDSVYMDYIGDISDAFIRDFAGADIAIRVKIYDLFDHLHPYGVNNIGEKHILRYNQALTFLTMTMNTHKMKEQRSDGTDESGTDEETERVLSDTENIQFRSY